MTLEIASILLFHWGFSNDLHENPDFILVIVLEIVDLIGMLITCKSKNFLFAGTRQFHSIPGCFFCHNRPETRTIYSFCRSKKKPVLLIFCVIFVFCSNQVRMCCVGHKNMTNNTDLPILVCLLFVTSFTVLSWQESETDSLSCQFPFFNIVTALLSSFDLDLFVGCVSTWRYANEHFSPKRQPFLFL